MDQFVFHGLKEIADYLNDMSELSVNSYSMPMDTVLLKLLEHESAYETISKLFFQKFLSSKQEGCMEITCDTDQELSDVISYCAIRLGIRVPRAFFSTAVHGINALTVGTDTSPQIIIGSLVPILLEKKEQRFIIGHECGHIAMKHMLYHNVSNMIDEFGTSIPLVGQELSASINKVFYHWSVRSEISADRAGLVCCKDQSCALNTIIKAEKGMLNTFFSVEELKNNRVLDDLFGDMENENPSHPSAKNRVKALLFFAESQKYLRAIGETQTPHSLTDDELEKKTAELLL